MGKAKRQRAQRRQQGVSPPQLKEGIYQHRTLSAGSSENHLASLEHNERSAVRYRSDAPAGFDQFKDKWGNVPVADLIGAHGVRARSLLLHLEQDTADHQRCLAVKDDALALAAIEVERFLSLELVGAPAELRQFRENWRARLYEITASVAYNCNRKRPSLWRLATAIRGHIFLDQYTGMGCDIYRDDHLWILSLPLRHSRELWVVVRNSLGLWTTQPAGFVPGANRRPPLSSFRSARQAARQWTGPTCRGALTGLVAERLTRALGARLTTDKHAVIGE